MNRPDRGLGWNPKKISFLFFLLFGATACRIAQRVETWREPAFALGGFAKKNTLADTTDAPAVVLSDKKRFELHLLFDPSTGRVQQRASLNVYRAVLIKNSNGLAWAELAIPYAGDMSISHLSAATNLPDGRTIPVGTSAVGDMLIFRPAGSTPSARWVKIIAFPEVVPGAIVEYRYTVFSDGWTLGHDHRLDDEIPIAEATYELIAPSFVETREATHGFKGPTRTNNMLYSGRFGLEVTTHRWNLNNYQPTPSTAFDLGPGARSPRVKISVASLKPERAPAQLFFDDWGIAAGVLWKSLDGVIDKAPEAVTVGLAKMSPREAATVVFSRVQRALDDRSAIEQAERGEQNVTTIYEQGFATEAERALVMLASLRAANVPATVAIVAAAGSDDIKESFPSADIDGQTLLVTLLDGKKRMYLDPSCRGCEAGELNPAHRGRMALIIVPNAQKKVATRTAEIGLEDVPDVTVEFARTPEEEPEESQEIELEYELAATPRGLVALKGKWIARGPEAAGFRHYFAEHPISGREREDYLRKKYLDGIEDGNISISGLDADRGPIAMHMTNVLLRRSGFVQAGGLWIIPVDTIVPAEWMSTFEESRSVPVYFYERPSLSNALTLRIPDGYELISAPESKASENKLGKYAMTVKTEGRSVTIRETLSFKNNEVAPADYGELYVFMRSIAAHRRRPVVMQKNR